MKTSDITRKKISKSLMGNKNANGTKRTDEWKKEHGEKMTGENNPNYGKKLSDITLLRMSIAQKGNKAHLGKPHSEETKKMISEKLIGRKLSLETRKKMSESHAREKSYLWRGGISFEKYTTDWTESLRLSIRERDLFVCQECGIHQDELIGRNRKLDIHHIDYNKKNCDPQNLISLCRNCHLKTNGNRDYWFNYFNYEK